MVTSWQLLPLRSTGVKPSLLVSSIFTTSSYKIHVTDMTHIWTEELDRKEIIRRAWDENTVVDPSQDAEQWGKFGELLQTGLKGGKGSKLGLVAGTTMDSLELRITVTLQAPLRDFEWPVRLAKMKQEVLTQELVIPLLSAQNARLLELESLVEILKEKDHVVQKLVDKLEATGTELGHIFPGAAGKGGRKLPRIVAEERVKGLGLFKKGEWEKEMRGKARDEEIGTVMKKVFTADSGVKFGTEFAGICTSRENWWGKLEDDQDGTFIEAVPDHLPAADLGAEGKKKILTSEDDKDDEDDADFQVQATPPSHRHRSPRNHKPLRIVADSTDDEDDLDVPSQRSTVTDSFSPKPATQSKRLGTIGGRKPPQKTKIEAVSKITSPGPSDPPVKVTGSYSAPDDQTTTEDEDEAPPKKSVITQIYAPSPSPSPAPAPKPKKLGLGRIGGKRKEVTQLEPLQSSAVEPADKQTTPAKPKLGHIGHKATEAEQERGRSEQVEEEKPRETSLERADRKRQEMKRQLEEAKSKAPPKKKKRF